MITHDISVVAQMCDQVAVMYAGKIVERGSVEQLFRDPFHPYTLGLEHAFPNLAHPRETLVSIEGSPPDLVIPPQGCRFHNRCPFAIDTCVEQNPPLQAVATGHAVACHRAAEVEYLRNKAREITTWQAVG
jgi:oligopeptide/dipeptide ABC transporter ATP-binding protein